MTPLDAIVDAFEICILFIVFLYVWVIFIADDRMLTDSALETKYSARGFLRLHRKEDETQ